MPEPIVPAPTITTCRIGLGAIPRADSGSFDARRSAEEDVDERFGLLAAHALAEQLPLPLAPGVERQDGGRLDRVHDLERRDLAPFDSRGQLARRREERRVALGRAEAVAPIRVS